MEELTYNKAIKQNLIHMNSNPGEWSILPVKRFITTKDNNNKEIVMPEFNFPVNYTIAPTLYNNDDSCGWCGHKIKRVFWVVNHIKQWILPVGSECIKTFVELTEEQEKEIKAIATVKPEEITKINNRIKEGETVKQAITQVRKLNRIEKSFYKKYPEPDQELENWWMSVLDKWDYSWYNNLNKDFQYWGLNWYGLNWPILHENAIDYLRLPKSNSNNRKTAHEQWEGYKKRYIEKKLSA